MKIIDIISKGEPFEILVDDEDFDWLSGYTWKIWRSGGTCYAISSGSIQRKMHRMILEHYQLLKRHEVVDHKDRNGLNNQKANLRPCTHSQNAVNRGRKTKGSSIYYGVTRHVHGWYARIKIMGRYECIGVFDAERDAAIAYDIRAKEVFGEFVSPNVPDASDEDKQRVWVFMTNPKRRRRATSKYLGVFLNGKCQTWGFNVFHNGKNVQRSGFSTEEEAATKRDAYITDNQLPVHRSLAA